MLVCAIAVVPREDVIGQFWGSLTKAGIGDDQSGCIGIKKARPMPGIFLVAQSATSDLRCA